MHGHMKIVKAMRYEMKPILEAEEHSDSESLSDESPTVGPIDWKTTHNAINKSFYMVLPIAFFASLTMAVTNPSTLFVYATLLCKNPLVCQKKEEDHYSGTFAVSTAVTNLCGILVLGLLPILGRRGMKAPLYFWLVSRALSVVLLLLGVYYKKLWVALCGRIFEGFAKDNILQLCLNAIFVHAPGYNQVSHFFGLSLALFMLGQALGSSVAGIFSDFRTSFVLAIGMFALCILYLFVVVPEIELAGIPHDYTDDRVQESGDFEKSSSIKRIPGYALASLQSLFGEPKLWPSQLTLLLYFGGASYALSAIMVYASLRFQFTVKENGWLVSIAATSGSVYLFGVLFILGKGCIASKVETRSFVSSQRRKLPPDFWLGILSLGLFTLIIPCVGLATQPWHLYPIVAVAAMGFSTPTFIRTYAVSLVLDGTQAITNLAFMEASGALLSPLILGGVQSKVGVKAVFIISSSMVMIGILALSFGAYYSRYKSRKVTAKSIESIDYQAL